MKPVKAILLFLVLLCLSSQAGAQFDISQISNLRQGQGNTLGGIATNNSGNRPVSDTTARSDTASADGMPKGIEYHEDIPDSILQASVFFFHRLPMEVKIMALEHPQLTPTGAQFCDPLDALNGDYYLNVSELGHPHYSLFPTFDGAPGMAYKPNIFPQFFKTPENIYFYQVQKPYTLLAYHSSLNKDYQIHVTHTQNINQRWNYALDYHLFSPTGAFANSSATDHLVDITTNYYSHDARYQLSAGFIFQKFVLGENGGLSNLDAFIDKRLSNMSGLPVNDNRRLSLSNNITLFVNQSFNTVRQFEWYRPIREQVIDTIVTHDTLHLSRLDSLTSDSVQFDSITTSTDYRLRDTIVGYDTIQPHKPHSYNTGVLAFDIRWERQKYRFTDSSLYNQFSALLYWTNDAYPDHRWHNPLKLYGGIRPQISFLQHDTAIYSSATLSEVAIYPFARMVLSPWKAVALDILAEATPNFSDYNLDARMELPFRDSLGNTIRSLTLRAVVKACGPELIYTAQQQRHNYNVNTPIHSVDTRKLSLDYQHGDLFDLHLAAQHTSHNIWFEKTTLADSTVTLIPHQPDGGAFLLQGRLNLYLTITRWLHFDMQQMVQHSSNQDLIRVPLFASKNSLYTDFYLFHRVLHTQVGVDLRYHTAYKADGYDPTLGVFYRQNEVEVGNYIWADFFINLQIKRASIYAKAGHLNSYLEQQAHCIIPGYPSKQFGFYFGLTWKFFD